MKIVLLGPPGSGTSTISNILSPMLKIPHISPGNLFQENIIKKTALGKKVKKIYDAGGMQTDDITIKMIIDRLKEPDCKDGFILDGFPRNLVQANALDKFTKIDFFIFIDIPEWLAVQRNTSRLTCEKCKRAYNPKGVRPREEGKCDSCGGRLIKRGDDNIESLKERFRSMGPEVLKPVTDHYKELGVFCMISCDNADTTPAENIKKVLEIIHR
jgi:adenylate kinase